MAYTVKFHEEYVGVSYINKGACDSCKRSNLPIQELPAEVNAGEYYDVKLCKVCLIKLANELEGQ